MECVADEGADELERREGGFAVDGGLVPRLHHGSAGPAVERGVSAPHREGAGHLVADLSRDGGEVAFSPRRSSLRSSRSRFWARRR